MGGDRRVALSFSFQCFLGMKILLLLFKREEISKNRTMKSIKYRVISGDDEFSTQKTGYSGSRNMVVSYKAPSMVTYRSDYTDVSVVHIQPHTFSLYI